MNKLLVLIFIIIVLAGCKSSSQSEDSSSNMPRSAEMSSSSLDIEESPTGYPDGEYCASIEYYNRDTGNSSSYTLTVHVENGELTQVDWPDGGWLDNSHFSPPEVDEDGTCSFSTYEGKDYTIQIDEKGGCSGNFGSPEEDDSEEEQRLEDQEKEQSQGDEE